MGKKLQIIEAVMLEKLSKENINKVNAAFGTFLLTIMGLLTPVITNEAIKIGSILWADFIIGGWIAFTIFMGIVIVSFFGSTNANGRSIKEIVGDIIDKGAEEIKEIVEETLEEILPDEPEEDVSLNEIRRAVIDEIPKVEVKPEYDYNPGDEPVPEPKPLPEPEIIE